MSRTARRQALFVSVFLIVVVLFVTTFQMGVVRGSSMQPTYVDGQVVLVRKRNFLSAPLHHNDVILFHKDRDVLIKRIYRLPGEELPDMAFPYVKFWMERNGLTDYFEQYDDTPPNPSHKRLFVQSGYLVVLGDNLRGSEDSRAFGPIPESDVIGVVVNSPPPPYTAGDSQAPGLNRPPPSPLPTQVPGRPPFRTR